ncbi:MAG: hypothetical protein EA406_13095 [Rhodospirillales bacterium]|nr:MAG: hypothetical protein EA406_13095 [Rhodospirillales bacterium]
MVAWLLRHRKIGRRRALLRTAPGPTIDPLCRALRLTLPPVFQELPSTEHPPETAEPCGA